MLCSYALRSFEKYGTRLDAASHEYVQRGVLVNYESLPGYVPLVLLPLFGVRPVPTAWLVRIKAESEYYSKGRGGKRMQQVFRGDSEDKDGRATESIRKYADLILLPSYEELNRKAVEALKSVAPELYARVVQQDQSPSGSSAFNWKLVGELPKGSAAGGVGVAQREEQHSRAISEVEFQHWLPFSNHHSSLPFEVERLLSTYCYSSTRYSIADSSLHYGCHHHLARRLSAAACCRLPQDLLHEAGTPLWGCSVCVGGS